MHYVMQTIVKIREHQFYYMMNSRIFHLVSSLSPNWILYVMIVMVSKGKTICLRRDSTILEYQKKLEAAGVRTKLVLIKSVVHSFFALPGTKLYCVAV